MASVDILTVPTYQLFADNYYTTEDFNTSEHLHPVSLSQYLADPDMYTSSVTKLPIGPKPVDGKTRLPPLLPGLSPIAGRSSPYPSSPLVRTSTPLERHHLKSINRIICEDYISTPPSACDDFQHPLSASYLCQMGDFFKTASKNEDVQESTSATKNIASQPQKAITKSSVKRVPKKKSGDKLKTCTVVQKPKQGKLNYNTSQQKHNDKLKPSNQQQRIGFPTVQPTVSNLRKLRL